MSIQCTKCISAMWKQERAFDIQSSILEIHNRAAVLETLLLLSPNPRLWYTLWLCATKSVWYVVNQQTHNQSISHERLRTRIRSCAGPNCRRRRGNPKFCTTLYVRSYDDDALGCSLYASLLVHRGG